MPINPRSNGNGSKLAKNRRMPSCSKKTRCNVSKATRLVKVQNRTEPWLSYDDVYKTKDSHREGESTKEIAQVRKKESFHVYLLVERVSCVDSYTFEKAVVVNNDKISH